MCRNTFPDTDLFLFELKHMDEESHREGTGVTNRLNLENLRRLARTGAGIIVRVPLIPDFKMDRTHVLRMGVALRGWGLKRVHLLPYHRLGLDKYRGLGRACLCQDLAPSAEKKIQKLQALLGSETGLDVSINGA